MTKTDSKLYLFNPMPRVDMFRRLPFSLSKKKNAAAARRPKSYGFAVVSYDRSGKVTNWAPAGVSVSGVAQRLADDDRRPVAYGWKVKAEGRWYHSRVRVEDQTVAYECLITLAGNGDPSDPEWLAANFW